MQDVKYTKSMQTGWKPPVKYRVMSEEERQKARDLFRIVIDGHNVPPPITTFQVGREDEKGGVAGRPYRLTLP